MWRKPEEPKVSSPSAAPSSAASSTPRAESSSAASASATILPATSANRAAVAAPPSGAVLTSTLVVRGEISGSGDLFVDGQVQGKIRIPGAKVTVGPQGRVSSDIEAREIVVRGSVQGSLHGVDRVEIASSGNVRGDVVAPRLVIEEGAEVQGSIEVERPAKVVEAPAEPAPVAESPGPVAFETVEP